MKYLSILLIFSLLIISGKSICDEKDVKIYGKDLTLTETTPFDVAFSNPEKFKDKEIVLEGVVTAVCQTTGCWFELTNGEENIRVKSEHQFFVPYDSKGKKVKVQGTLYTKVLTEATHCDKSEDEANKGEKESEVAIADVVDAAEVEIKKESKLVLFNATGVAMIGGSDFTQEQLDKIEGKKIKGEHSDHHHD